MLALSLWRTTKAAHIRVDEKKINTNTMLQKRCLQNMMNPQMFLQLFYIYLIFFNGGCWERNWTRTSGKEYPRIIPKTNPLWTNRHVGFPFCCPGLVPLEWRRDHFFHFFTDHKQSAKVPVMGSFLWCIWKEKWEHFSYQKQLLASVFWLLHKIISGDRAVKELKSRTSELLCFLFPCTNFGAKN